MYRILFAVAMYALRKREVTVTLSSGYRELTVLLQTSSKIVMNVAPIGIFCLLANVAGTTGFKVIIPMLKFLLVLLIGDAIQFLLFGPFTAAVTKVNIFKMPKKFAKMSMMAVTTTRIYLA